jgi:hypothetical protein
MTPHVVIRYMVGPNYLGITEADSRGVAYGWQLTMITLKHLIEIGTQHDVPRLDLS